MKQPTSNYKSLNNPPSNWVHLDFEFWRLLFFRSLKPSRPGPFSSMDGLTRAEGYLRRGPQMSVSVPARGFSQSQETVVLFVEAGDINLYINEQQPLSTQPPSVGPQAAVKNCLTARASRSTRTVQYPKDSEVD